MKLNGIDGKKVYRQILKRDEGNQYIFICEEEFGSDHLRIELLFEKNEETGLFNSVEIGKFDINREHIPINSMETAFSFAFNQKDGKLSFDIKYICPAFFKYNEIEVSDSFELDKEYKQSILDNLEEVSDEELLFLIKDMVGYGHIYDANPLVINNIDFIDRLTNIINSASSSVIFINQNRTDRVQEELDLVQEYLDYIKVDLNVKKMIEDKIVYVRPRDGSYVDGKCGYEDGILKVNAELSHTIKDPIVLMHELIHYSNHPQNGPEEDRNRVSAMLTEALSYTYELIMTDYLKNKEELTIENEKYIHNFIRNMAGSAAELLPIIYILKAGDNLTIESVGDKWKELKNIIINMPKNYNAYRNCIYSVIGIAVALHNYYEYKQDPTYLDRIKMLNDNLNKISFEEALSIMGVSNEKDLEEVINTTVPGAISILKEEAKRMFDFVEGDKNEHTRIPK